MVYRARRELGLLVGTCRMVAILRVRFDTSTDAESVWLDVVFRNWMRSLAP